MVIRVERFNIYLLLLIALSLTLGCQNAEYKRKRQKAVLRVHMEAFRDGTGLTQPVVIGRSSPITVIVQTIPFLTEDNVVSAKIIDALGGFSLQIKFDQTGTRLLELYTASNPRKRVAISSQFGEKLSQSRWLAAPVIPKRISDGMLTFTPDADLKEAEQIELGLNNHARLNQPKSEREP